MSQTVIYCLRIERFVKFIVLLNHVTQIAVTTNIIYLADVSVFHNQWRNQEICLVGGLTNSVEDKGQRDGGSGGGSPLVSVSGGSCNLAQEISFHIAKLS